MNEVALLIKSLEFSSLRHRKQFRKGQDETPYINHPIQVANLLANVGNEKDISLLIAAILHAIIEDTANNEKERKTVGNQILNLFGEQVYLIVCEVTDNKDLDKDDRKRLQIEHASGLSDNAKKLKLADKILNVHDIAFNPPADWTDDRIIAYFDWAEKVVSGLRGVNKDLENLFDDILTNAKAKVAKSDSKFVLYMHEWSYSDYDEYLSVHSDGCTIHFTKHDAIDFESKVNRSNTFKNGKTSDGLVKIQVPEDIYIEVISNENKFISKTDSELNKLEKELKIVRIK